MLSLLEWHQQLLDQWIVYRVVLRRNLCLGDDCLRNVNPFLAYITPEGDLNRILTDKSLVADDFLQIQNPSQSYTWGNFSNKHTHVDFSLLFEASWNVRQWSIPYSLPASLYPLSCLVSIWTVETIHGRDSSVVPKVTSQYNHSTYCIDPSSCFDVLKISSSLLLIGSSLISSIVVVPSRI